MTSHQLDKDPGELMSLVYLWRRQWSEVLCLLPALSFVDFLGLLFLRPQLPHQKIQKVGEYREALVTDGQIA